MMKSVILKLNEVNIHSIELVGGKGANLGELISKRFSVPEGFCISVEAYKQFIVQNGLQEKINEVTNRIQWNNPTSIEEKSAVIREYILNQDISLAIKGEIIKAYNNLVNTTNGVSYVAVRSSATAEDLPDASFAGQQETFLYVKGEDDVLQYVKRCWASLWTSRAMAYRHKKEFQHDKVFIAVIVQQMVDAAVSGVMFTSNPMTLDDDEIYITASYGLGELVVSGQVTPDSFILSKKNMKIISRELGSKEKELIPGPEERTVLLEVNDKKRLGYSLSIDQIKELGALAKQVEEHYQFPQDIEWAIAEGNLYLLQSRPITTLSKAKQYEQVDIGRLTKVQIKILDDLLEHYPEVPTPLDYSLVTMSYQAILDRAEGLGITFPKATNIIQMNKEGEVKLLPPKLSFNRKVLLLPYKLIKASKGYEKNWDDVEHRFNSFIEKLNLVNLDQLSDRQLVDELENVFQMAKNINDLRFQLLVDSSIASMLVLSAMTKLFTNKKERPNFGDVITRDLNYKTTEIDRKLIELAIFASENEEVQSFILTGDYRTVNEFDAKLQLLPYGKETREKIQSFLSQNGFRTDKMYQPFSSKSWLDDQMYFLDILKAVMNDPHLLHRKSKETLRNEIHRQWLVGFEKQLKGPFKAWFKSSYTNLRQIYIYREETVFFIEKLFHYGRKIMDELAISLTNKGILENKSDASYIFREEFVGLVHENIDPNCIRDLISIRKENMVKNEVMWKQSIIQLATKIESDGVIVGSPGSNGLVEGPVRVITKVDDFKKLKQGEILVCQYTDPAWTPLFGIAAAVVADTGGPLSHAAIVAREYEIPAVLGTKIGTSLLKDGDQIIVDGSTGKVIKK